MRHWLAKATNEVTVILLLAGSSLIAGGVAGLGADLPLLVGLSVGAVATFALRWQVPDLGYVAGHEPSQYLRDVWVGFTIAVGLLLAVLGATPGELQTVGGLVGLVGMANYFLRPVYFAVYSVVATVTDVGRPENS